MKRERLFRYRGININNVVALNNDMVYTVIADKFNDPYDSLLQYDLDLIEKYDLDMIEKIINGTANIEFFKLLRKLIINKVLPKITNCFPQEDLNNATEACLFYDGMQK